MNESTQDPDRPKSPVSAHDAAPTLPGNDQPLQSPEAVAEQDPRLLREKLRDAEERLGFVLESIKDYALLLLDVDGVITGWSAGAERILGYSEKEILGERLHRIFTAEDNDNKIPEQELNLSKSEGRATDDRWHVRKDGSLFWATGFVRPLFLFETDKKLRGYAKLVRDLTAVKKTEERIKELNQSLEIRVAERTRELDEKNKELSEEIEHRKTASALAIRDGLTDLYNHRYLQQHGVVELNHAIRHQTSLSCAMLDIDNFKAINDSYGHPFGDEVLRGVARIIRDEVRRVDTAGRYGGEEFLILMPHTTAQEALPVVERLRIKVQEFPFRFEDKNVQVTLSIGLATYDDTQSAQEKDWLLKAADEALYQAKNGGKNRTQVWSPPTPETRTKFHSTRNRVHL